MSSSLFTPLKPAPKAKRVPHETVCGAHRILDDYAWLRADNWRDVMVKPDSLATEIKDYLLAENAYCDSALDDTSVLQETLVKEMRARICEDDTDVPMEDGAYAYFFSYEKGNEHPCYARRKTLSGGKLDQSIEILLDGNKLAAKCAYFDLGTVIHSPDHHYLAYAIDIQGSEYYDIYIQDIRTGKTVSGPIASASPDIIWGAKSEAIFWIWRDKNNRPKEVRQHDFRAQNTEDRLLYHEEDEGFFLSLSQTSDRQYILIEASDHSTSEVRVLYAQAPEKGIHLLAPRKTGVEYHIDHAGDYFYILTNSDGAEDFKIMRAPDETPMHPNWQELVPAKAGVRRLEQRLFKSHLVWLERCDALPRIIIRHLPSGKETTISFSGQAYALGLEHLLDFDTKRMRFCTSSMAEPETVYDYDMDSHVRTLRKTQHIPAGHDASAYQVHRIMAPAHDGEEIPVSLIYKKGLKRDGAAPLLLYGYGAYGITIPASFSPKRLSLLDRGFVYAIAHIRGGEAKGHVWYTAATGAGKPKTFQDFIDVADHLIDQGYTAKGKVIAMGGSAGGLLVGAVMNIAPELFGGVIAAVPFVDVLNTMSDETLPLTPPEWPEWGNPIEDEAAFATIKSYSPYDNISDLAYPPLLATAGLTDPRVTYWEPAKWVAKLRAMAPDTGPFLLKTEMQAGHGGATGRFEGLKTTALEYAFAIKAAGLF
ncbi:MAG: S9 family peptidase [Robiginitomaculum sp.]|nr:MAG: S9 family peptidase [Robiginitomaculum sp.]